MVKPAWCPDWSGGVAAIVAAGASAVDADFALLRGRCRVIVVNRSCELVPWADALYVADGRFWENSPAARSFVGLRITAHRDAARAYKLQFVTVSGEHRFLIESAGTIGHGGHSGFQAINLAVQFGARRILLIGFDLCGEHWHERHAPPLRDPRPQTLDKWRRRLDGQADRLAELGVDVVNCSLASALTRYQKLPLPEALHRFGLLDRAAA